MLIYLLCGFILIVIVATPWIAIIAALEYGEKFIEEKSFSAGIKFATAILVLSACAGFLFWILEQTNGA